MDAGRAVLTLQADEARERYRKIRARFAATPPTLKFDGALSIRTNGRDLEVIANGASPAIEQRLRAENPEELSTESLSLEEIFVATLKS